MSATRELLVEQIAQVELDIKEADAAAAAVLRERLLRLQEQLKATNQALTEGAVLKG